MHKPSNASSLFEPGNLENQPGFEQQHFRALICLFHLTYPLSPVNGSIKLQKCWVSELTFSLIFGC